MNKYLESYYVITALTNAESRIYLNNDPRDGEPYWTGDLENARRFNVLKEVTECQLPAGHLTRNATAITVMKVTVQGEPINRVILRKE